MNRPRIRRALAAAWLALAGAACGCDNSMPPQGQQMFASGRTAYEAKDYTRAIERMDAVLALYSHKNGADEAFLYRGAAKYETRDYAGARSDLREAVAAARSDAIRAHSYYHLGNVGFDTGDMPLAIEGYSKGAALADADKSLALVAVQSHYRLGTALQRQSLWEAADDQFRRVVYLDPDGPAAKEAARRVNCRAWTVRAGAYGSKSAADGVAARLKQLGFDATAEPDRTPKPQFVVCVGRFGLYEQAAQLLPRVKQHQSDAYVYPTE